MERPLLARAKRTSSSKAASDLEKAVLRSPQAEMIAQCCSVIVGAEQAALLQNRYHELDEILEAFVEIRRHHVEAVRGVTLEPLLQGVGDAFGRAAQHPMAACGGGEIVEVAQCHVLSPSLGEHDAGKAVIAVGQRNVRNGSVQIVG